jgi:uncharacterized protein YjbI with pentapeptide repeats
VSAAPRSPHPPDPDPDAEPPSGLDDVVDARIENADYANARFVRSSLRRVELHLCRLTGAELAEASWQDVTVSDCRLDLTGLRHSMLERVVFRDCILDEAEFAGARLKDVHFERCRLRLATFAGATSARLQLEGCDLEGLDGIDVLRGARMRWDDVVQNAPLFARALGIELVEPGDELSSRGPR